MNVYECMCLVLSMQSITQIRKPHAQDVNTLPSPALPNSTTTCNHRQCAVHTWSVSEWSPCSAACGGGTMSRDVRCVSSDLVTVEAALCSGMAPASNAACNTFMCGLGCGGGPPCGQFGMCSEETGRCASWIWVCFLCARASVPSLGMRPCAYAYIHRAICASPIVHAAWVRVS